MYAFAAIHGDKINAYGTGYQCLFFDAYCSCHVTFPHLIVNHYCYLVSLFLDKSLRSNITGKMHGKCLITIKYNILDLTAFETSFRRDPFTDSGKFSIDVTSEFINNVT